SHDRGGSLTAAARAAAAMVMPRAHGPSFGGREVHVPDAVAAIVALCRVPSCFVVWRGGSPASARNRRHVTENGNGRRHALDA
ncbi:hypothetical protein, partial [Burkholderia pseudomallei]